jgi:YesN/AraC family two-component response regulator
VRVLIVDDEPNARSRLQVMLEELDVEVIGEAQNGVEALAMVKRHRPDLLLLDVQMPEVDGFDVARHLPDGGPMVVFQTAHDEFALKAFDHEALDYFVKPVTLKRLSEALDRARKRMGAASASAYPPELIEQLRRAVDGTRPSGPHRLLVRNGRGHRLLQVGLIHSFVARAGEVYA